MADNRYVNVSVCTVNNWALDFDGNRERILKTCRDAFSLGARIRLGPELEIPSYGCEDHFLESGTEAHSWRVLHSICEESKKMENLLIITGMPVRYNGALYNCMISVINGEIIFIYPKSTLCNDDIYRESRWFVPWNDRTNCVSDFMIPRQYGFKQKTTHFGGGYLQSADGVKVGFEMCEELWTAKSPSMDLALEGVEIFCNASGSHHVLGKSCYRIKQLVLGTTSKVGGIYLYSNHRGCDGTRVYYDGMSSIAQNDELYAQINQFDIEETCTVNCVLNLRHTENFRGRITSTCLESSKCGGRIPKICFNFDILEPGRVNQSPSKPITTRQRSNVDELCHGPPAYLWNYLRRSGASGFFLPLSGGQDSSSVALMVRLMCEKVCQAVRENPDNNDPSYYFMGSKVGTDPSELCAKVFYTCYMGSVNSSEGTREAAKLLSQSISSNHSNVLIDTAVEAFLGIFSLAYSFTPSFSSSDIRETMALQNLQARIRMVMSYLFAQASLIYHKRPGGLLVLGSSNVDESLIGYLTKYDCSSADINVIGSISKRDLREFLKYVHDNYNFLNLERILDAVPTAELRPLVNGEVAQTDEDEIGLTYDELSIMGRLRRPGGCDPYTMFVELVPQWHPSQTYEQIANKVEIFFRRYAINRHKATVSTPAYHANVYSNDDHRNDHRPFLYPNFSLQFREIRKLIEQLKSANGANNNE